MTETATATAAAAALAHAFARLYPEEVAREAEAWPADDISRLVQSAPGPQAARMVESLASNVAADVFRVTPADAARRILVTMDPVRAVAALAWLDEEPRSALVDGLPGGAAREIHAMASYPPDTAGRLMDPRVIGLHGDTPAGEALARLRHVRRRLVSDVFVTGDDARLIGRVPLQDLALAPAGEPLRALLKPAVSVAGTAGMEEVVERLTDGRLASLPVVDFEERLLGVIRHDTLVKTAQQDAAADMQAMVGASRQERALSRVSFAVRKRLPWLQVNLGTAFLAAAVVGLFESTIAQFTALAVLLPVVAGESGNTGAQSLAVTMRGLALREIRVGHWARVARKEAAVASINSMAVCVTTAAAVFLWSGSAGLAGVIAIAMVLSMVAAGVAGVVIPVTLTALGQDPAQSSSIILTTVTDVVGFASFLGIATMLARVL